MKAAKVEGRIFMRRLTNTTASKVVASIAVWFVVFLILLFGGFTFVTGWSYYGTVRGTGERGPLLVFSPSRRATLAKELEQTFVLTANR